MLVVKKKKWLVDMKSGDGKKLNPISWIECQDGKEMKKTNILI